jgi:hypothetical protein
MSILVFITFIYLVYEHDCYSAHYYDVADNKRAELAAVNVKSLNIYHSRHIFDIM